MTSTPGSTTSTPSSPSAAATAGAGGGRQGSTKTEWWHAVLGEYPTGVTLICARDADGDPIGLVVGSFTAVSQDPPLIGFFPDRTSTTYPLIARAGRFTASVLGDTHEQLCRAFVRKAPDRFEVGSFVDAPSGTPRLADAVTWFDAVIERQDSYGDHEFVVARVEHFGVGDADAGLPLLFRRGGYGSFAVPAIEFDSLVLARQLRFADENGAAVAALADRLGHEVMVSAVVQDSVVVLAFARPGAGTEPAPRRIGSAFPFAAPLAPAFVAWDTVERQSAWIESSRHLVGAVDRERLGALLASVRRRGYGLSPHRALSARFTDLMDSDRPGRASFAQLWSDMSMEGAVIEETPDPDTASAVQAPVFGPGGRVEVVLTVNGFAELPDAETFADHAAVVVEAAAEMTHSLGGTVPPLSDE